MYTLTEEQFQQEAVPALRKIFVNRDPFDEPFALTVQVRRIIYPTGIFHFINFKSPHPDAIFVSSGPNPETSFLDVIVSAAKSVDDGFYFSLAPWSGIQEQDEDLDINFYYDFGDLESFRAMDYLEALVVSLEWVIFSPSGRWGLLISEDADHGLLGCTESFLNEMQGVFPECCDIKQVQKFLSDWEYYAARRGADISWIPGLLTHVCGADTAQRFLEEAEFNKVL